MCLVVTLSSSLQAHHSVWRKLRQRAEKLVRKTDISVFYLTHSSKKQWHQSWSTQAYLENEGRSCLGAVLWSRWWILVQMTACSTSSQLAPRLKSSLHISRSSQRIGFNAAIFIALHLYLKKKKERKRQSRDTAWVGVFRKKQVSSSSWRTNCCFLNSTSKTQTLTRDPRKEYF